MNSQLTTLTFVLLCHFVVAICPRNEDDNYINRCFENCDTTVFSACQAEKNPLGGCFCKKGYKRGGFLGGCIPEKDCPCTGRNEMLGCEPEGGQGCEPSKGPRICDICVCKKNYKRINGVCLPDYHCPNKKCSNTEEHRTNTNRCLESCYGTQKRCIHFQNEPGCYCKKGLSRDADGNCVKNCPKEPICKNKYESFHPFKSGCTDHCNKATIRCMDDRQSGCYCNDGYARDLNSGLCRPYPCGRRCGENAQWVHCSKDSCDNECDFVTKKRHCEINHIVCPDACRCNKGFARRFKDSKDCIPESNCRKPIEIHLQKV